MPKGPVRVREQAVVYMSSQGSDLLERPAEETGLPRTELLRRGLHRLAEEMLPGRAAGSSIDFLIDLPEDSDAPSDLSLRHDHYIYGGGHRPENGGWVCVRWLIPARCSR